MSNRLGVLLLWGIRVFVALFPIVAMSLPGVADAESVMGIVLRLGIAVTVCLSSIWPARFFWAVTMAIRLPVLALLLMAACAGRLLMRIDHVVTLAGRRVLEIGHGQ